MVERANPAYPEFGNKLIKADAAIFVLIKHFKQRPDVLQK